MSGQACTIGLWACRGEEPRARVRVNSTNHTLHSLLPCSFLLPLLPPISSSHLSRSQITSHLPTLPPPSPPPSLLTPPPPSSLPLPHHFHMSELCRQVQGSLFLVVSHVCVRLLFQQVLHHLSREHKNSERMYVHMYGLFLKAIQWNLSIAGCMERCT